MGDLKIDLKSRVRRILSQIQYWGCQGDCMTAISLLSGGGANQADVFMLLS